VEADVGRGAARSVLRDCAQDGSFPVLQLDCLKGISVTSIVLAMVAILAVAAGVVGMVAIGMQGRGEDRAPKLASTMARAARHLNGDGKPPERFLKLIQSAHRS